MQNYTYKDEIQAKSEVVPQENSIELLKKFNTLEIASRFRAIRKAAFFSQEEIGKIIGVSNQQVQKYEAAMDRIPAVSLYLVAKALNISAKEFFPESTVNNAGNFISNEVWVIARKLMAIKNPDVRKKLSSLLSCMVDG